MINKKIPPFILKKLNIIQMLVFTALFSLVFINIYRPFSSPTWMAYSRTEFFLLSCVIVFSGITVLSISRALMYFVYQRLSLNYLQYYSWLVAEIMFISAAYTFIVRFALHVDKDFIVLFAATFFYTALVLLLPYCVSWLYFALHETEQELERLMSREDNFANMIPVEKDEMLHFRDEKGELRLSVAMSNLLFIKTSDNYVEIHYLYKNSPHRFLLRNSLKNMEEQYTSPMFFRCHRSYIVNFQKVKMLKNDKESMSLEMDIEGIPSIQVSKSYTNKVIKYFAGT